MTKSTLSKLVFSAITLEQEIAEKSQSLKDIKAALISEASTHQSEYLVTEGGGRSWMTEDSCGHVARIAFPCPSLKSSIQSESPALQKIRLKAGPLFHRLFIPSLTYRPVSGFREEAKLLLGKSARELIKLCQTETPPRVIFEVNKPLPVTATP